MWDANEYNKFAAERERPFADLLEQAAQSRTVTRQIVDLGCGPGRLTRQLAERWPAARVVGVDNSPEMLAKAQPLAILGRLEFVQADLAAWSPDQPVDLILSNAALHWIADHDSLLRRLTGWLAPGGTLAVQMPNRFDGPVQKAIDATAADPRWAAQLRGVGLHRGSVQKIEWYARHLQSLGFLVNAWETTYVHVLTGKDPVCSNGFEEAACDPCSRSSTQRRPSSSAATWPLGWQPSIRPRTGQLCSPCRGCSSSRRVRPIRRPKNADSFPRLRAWTRAPVSRLGPNGLRGAPSRNLKNPRSLGNVGRAPTNRGPREGENMTPRLSKLLMPAVAIASLSGAVLACKPGDKKQTTSASFASVGPEEQRADRVKAKPSKFRSMVLEQFDANGNGRLDSKERAAANKALSAKEGTAASEALREQALAEFDKNHNGKLEKTEIHKALSSVNASVKTAQTAEDDSSKHLAADQRVAAKELQQQMFASGIDTPSGQIQTLQNLLNSNGGTLTAAETALAQTLLSQLISQAAATTTLTPAATTTTGTTGTGTTTSSTGTGMCSGGSSGSSTGTGSSGTTSLGTGTGTSTTSSARTSSTNQNVSSPVFSGGGGRGFGGFGGGFRGFRGR